MRNQKRPTQSEIARRCGIDVSSVNKILNRRQGPVFKKQTVDKVFKVAQQLGYDVSRLKHSHARAHPRKTVDLPFEICLYRADGTVYDKGKASASNLSLSGVLLGGLTLPARSLPVTPFRVGVRVPGQPKGNLEIMGDPVRLSYDGSTLKLAIRFPQSEESKLDALRKFL